MRRAYLMLPTAALVLAGCGSAPKADAGHHAVQSPAANAQARSRSTSPGAAALIADTAVDVATCHQFAAERAGQISADQFNAWLLRHGGQTTIGPESSTGLDNTLSTTLGDWYVVLATAPSGDLQPANYYAAEVRMMCGSIGA